MGRCGYFARPPGFRRLRYYQQESGLRGDSRRCRPTPSSQPHPRWQGAGVHVYDNGRGTLEDNDIFGNAYAGVAIKKGANPTVRGNRIHDSKQGGVFVYENGEGTLEDNDIFGNANAGVVISGSGNPTLRSNRINKNGYEAIWIYEGGGGVFEDNDLRDNAKGAWDISDDSKANVKATRNLE